MPKTNLRTQEKWLLKLLGLKNIYIKETFSLSQTPYFLKWYTTNDFIQKNAKLKSYNMNIKIWNQIDIWS